MSARVELRHRPERERDELRDYLGPKFDPERLRDWEAQLDREFERVGDEARFYRTSTGYLYNLTVFAMSPTKLPYLRALVEHCRPGERVLDYGCGIGSDGLTLLEAGYRVEFADFDNPSTTYLRWRLGRRGLSAPVHDLDRHVPGAFEAAYAFDVIEHVERPFELLAEMEARARLVIVNLLEPKPGETALHHELPLRALRAYVSSRRLVSYTVHHGRSHLVIYSPQRVGRLRAARQRGGLVASSLARRLGRVLSSARD